MTKLMETKNPREQRVIQRFGDPKITIGGKKRDVRRMIEEASKDTRIYEQIDKYGLNPIQEINIEDTVNDFTELSTDLRGALEIGMAAKQQWKKLPREIRNQFDNDIERFTKEGANWFKEQKAKIEQMRQAELKKQENFKIETGEIKNVKE